MRRTKAQAKKEAEEIVENWIAGAALTGWIPGSTFFLGAGDMLMIRQVADAFGIGVFDKKAMKAHLAGAVGSAVGGGLVAEGLGLVPFVGWALKSGAMATKAAVMGKAVIEYFEEQSPL
ncbi:MAG TPA: hypothetical protein VF618_04320 [Thermoanaerobaculia bacterium]